VLAGDSGALYRPGVPGQHRRTPPPMTGTGRLRQSAGHRRDAGRGRRPGSWRHTATARVARRLADSGYLTEVASRLPWRAGRWIPANPDAAFMPLNRARAALYIFRPVTAQAAALAGLAAACGLETLLLSYAPPPRGRSSPQDAAGLLARPAGANPPRPRPPSSTAPSSRSARDPTRPCKQFQELMISRPPAA
jgi:Golgi phosphoprotein 3 GPP34